MPPETPTRSVNYFRNTLISILCRGHIEKMKPATAAEQGVAIPLSLTETSKKSTSWSMMILFPIKRRKKLAKKRKRESVK